MSALGVRSCKFPFSSKLVTPAGSGGGDIPVAASDWLGRSAWVMGAVVHATGHVIAQMILVAPIVAALTRQTIEDLWTEYRDELTAMGIGPAGRAATLTFDARFSLVTALLAGFGRAAAEVGAVLIVGGNIDGFTRTMTTAITLETSKGDLPLAIGLGLVLIALVVVGQPACWGVR